MIYPKIGIRPVIDGRQFGVREDLEQQTMDMAYAAQKLIESRLRYPDGTKVQCVIATKTIGGGAEAYECETFFQTQNVCATLSVTPCWCYGSETMDLNPLTIKAVWGFNGTERPGAVYLAASMAAHAQRGLPAFAIYGKDVQDKWQSDVPESGEIPEKKAYMPIPADVEEKILRFAKCAVAVGVMRNKAYVGLGGVSMGIAGSYCNSDFFQKYLGIRAEWVDLTEILRRIHLGIYDHDEYEKALAWVKANCPEGYDVNRDVPEDKKIDPFGIKKPRTAEEKAKEWEFIVKFTLIVQDIFFGNPKLLEMGWAEESHGRNAILGGFQGQRMWTDWLPNGDFTEAILNSSFDWNGKKEPSILATENDGLNGTAMLFGKLLTGTATIFADVRTYWSPEAVKRVTGVAPTGRAAGGFIHLINSGAAALDGTGACRDENGTAVMKPWWEVSTDDIQAMLAATDWAPANLGYFRGGGFSSHYRTRAEMPVTMIRVNILNGTQPLLQIAEGYTVDLPDEIHQPLDERTDKTWPTTWFVPNLTGEGAFTDVYHVMANWGANHGCLAYGHIGADLITLASMLRIPVSMHNVSEDRIYRPHTWSAYGTKDLEAADYRACADYGPLY
ncbi:L-fucose isomerase [Ruminococcus callidus]|uniref:L-fucose isomerase n=1 Tax=Ruminococcus callidus TaxID=40519 RepID=UPI0039A11839